MTLPPWLRTGWTLFFALMSASTLVFFVIPFAFGLQHFNQWGGMYDDRWCHADFYSGDPVAAGTQKETVNAGEYKTKRVYSAPAHNQLTCLLWAQAQCGTKSNAGWTIVSAHPYLRGKRFPGDACSFALPKTSFWFAPHE